MDVLGFAYCSMHNQIKPMEKGPRSLNRGAARLALPLALETTSFSLQIWILPTLLVPIELGRGLTKAKSSKQVQNGKALFVAFDLQSKQ